MKSWMGCFACAPHSPCCSLWFGEPWETCTREENVLFRTLALQPQIKCQALTPLGNPVKAAQEGCWLSPGVVGRYHGYLPPKGWGEPPALAPRVLAGPSLGAGWPTATRCPRWSCSRCKSCCGRGAVHPRDLTPRFCRDKRRSPGSVRLKGNFPCRSSCGRRGLAEPERAKQARYDPCHLR